MMLSFNSYFSRNSRRLDGCSIDISSTSDKSKNFNFMGQINKPCGIPVLIPLWRWNQKQLDPISRTIPYHTLILKTHSLELLEASTNR